MKIITDGWRRIFCVICWMASGRRIPYYLLDIFGLFQWKSNHSQHLVTKLSDINSSEWDLNLIQILSLVSIHLSTHKLKLISNIRSYIFFLSRYFKTQHVSLAQFLGDEIEVILIKFAVIVWRVIENYGHPIPKTIHKNQSGRTLSFRCWRYARWLCTAQTPHN